MKRTCRIITIAAGFFGILVCRTLAEGDEHYLEEQRFIADNAFALVLAEISAQIVDGYIYVPNASFSICFEEKALLQDKTFGEISANLSEDKFSYARFHKRGQTIFEQLKALSVERLEKVYQEHCSQKSIDAVSRGDWSRIRSATQLNQNVVVNYFLYHYIALGFAQRAGQAGESGKEDLRRALIYEARAQSYLRNAFYAGHMLVPLHYPLFMLHHRNTKEAYNFYRNTGVFVINACGDSWQTFGGRILQSHAPTYRYVLEASLTSLRELFLVYYAFTPRATIPEYLISDEMKLSALKEVVEIWKPKDKKESYYGRIFLGYETLADDDAIPKRFIPAETSTEKIQEIGRAWTMPQKIEHYYSDLQNRMPALLLFPMPVSATWNARLPETDRHGIHRRFHYPQFREDDYYDPGLEDKPLYSKNAVPNWMVPNQLIEDGPDYLIKNDPNFASVHYVQDRDFLPSYKGLLFHFGGSAQLKEDASFGFGYGLIDRFGPLNKASVEVSLMPAFRETRRFLAVTKFGGGIKLPKALPLLDGVYLGGGYVRALRDPFEENGTTLALGIAAKTIPLGFTYIGATVRLKYQWFWLEKTLRGAFLEFILH